MILIVIIWIIPNIIYCWEYKMIYNHISSPNPVIYHLFDDGCFFDPKKPVINQQGVKPKKLKTSHWISKNATSQQRLWTTLGILNFHHRVAYGSTIINESLL